MVIFFKNITIWRFGIEVFVMFTHLDWLRQFNLASVALRLTLAVLCGGMLGLERARKQRPAGFRTYMLVCMGAALTMILGQYEAVMLASPWAASAAATGVKTDVCRFGAQVINGVGFLGAGTIILTGRQQVKGLTTAAGLWSAACMGLAIGAGFYEAVFLAFIFSNLVVHLLPRIERRILENARDMNLFVEFHSLDQVGEIIRSIKAQGGHIHDVELDHGNPTQHPSAIFSIRMDQRGKHAKVMAVVSELESVYVIHNV